LTGLVDVLTRYATTPGNVDEADYQFCHLLRPVKVFSKFSGKNCVNLIYSCKIQLNLLGEKNTGILRGILWWIQILLIHFDTLHISRPIGFLLIGVTLNTFWQFLKTGLSTSILICNPNNTTRTILDTKLADKNFPKNCLVTFYQIFVKNSGFSNFSTFFTFMPVVDSFFHQFSWKSVLHLSKSLPIDNH